MPVYIERRRRVRADVHWVVRLIRHPSRAPVESVTDNLSSEGFYCRCDEAFVPGEFLECLILIPTQARRARQEGLVLRGLVQVVRVEGQVSGGRCGMGFHIEKYLVVRPEPAPGD